MSNIFLVRLLARQPNFYSARHGAGTEFIWIFSSDINNFIFSYFFFKSSTVYPPVCIPAVRNILVTLLALADLLTALTMPLTAMDSLWLHWPLADQNLIFCRCVILVCPSLDKVYAAPIYSTYEESLRGAASGLTRCNFFGLQTSLQSFFLVQMG